MKVKQLLILSSALALLQQGSALWAQTNLANALDATNLVWTTGGTGGVGWSYHSSSGSANDSFDGIASAQSGHIGDNGETWIQTTVVGPGTVSFWWQAYSEPNADWLEFYVSDALQGRISGGGDDYSTWASGWQYSSFPVPAGTNVLKWRYVKDSSSTGGTMDTVWVDQVSYVTTPPPPLEQALDTTGVQWDSSGSVYPNGWFSQSTVTHDGQWAARSGAIYHNQTNWLQATVTGATNVGFWWKVSSEPSADFLEFYINGAFAGQISGEVDWQFAYFQLPPGNNVLTWQYRRNASLTAGANCGWLDQVVFNTAVARAGTTTTLAASLKTSVVGQPVTFTATVTPTGSGTPTGTVTFKDGGTILGTGTLSAGKATCTTSALGVGSRAVTAVYQGDGYFNGSTSTAVTDVVSQASSTTALTSSSGSAVFGQPLTLTATVNPASPSTGAPGGTVTFKDGTTNLGTATLSTGQATFISSSLSVASHTVTAVYNGDTGFKTSSSSTLKLTVSKASSSAAIASSVNPSSFGQTVIFSAIISPAAPSTGTPTGTVQFKTNGVNCGSAVTLSGGSASSAPITGLPAAKGSTVTAVYSGDTGFNTSTSVTLTQTVVKADTATALASSAIPSVFGQPVVFTATVSGVGGGLPSGTVIFKDGATALRTNTLSGGQASYTNSTLVLGSHSLTAVYSGSTAGFNGSDSTASPLMQTVGQAASATTVASSANPSVIGQSVSFTATVKAAAPGAGTPTGTVQFALDGWAWGSPLSLSAGKAASSSISTLALGSHTVTATYSGDANFTGSDNSASPLAQIVNKPSPTISITSSKNPAIVGDPVVWTAALSASPPASGTPTGTVQFKVDGANYDGQVTLSGGRASSLALATLGAGTHTIAVAYSGDANFNTTTSASFTQTVNTSPVTPATGGIAISADTAGGAYTSLTGPSYKESAVGTVSAGTIILKVPTGFVFDTAGVAPTVMITGSSTSANNINDAVSGTNLPITSVSSTQLTFTVTAASAGKTGTPNTLTWQNVRVRPAAGTPLASGIITRSGTATMTGVATNTSFGFLAEAAGAASGLALQTQPSPTAIVNVPFAQQPVVRIRDQFGNALTFANRNADNSTAVTAALATGAGSLQGTLTVTAANGLAAYSDLSCSASDTQITIGFTSGSLASVISGQVAVSLGLTGAASAEASSQPLNASQMAVNAQVSQAPLVIRSLTRQSDGSMGLTATGIPGKTYSLQACERLGAWATIGSIEADANGTIVFVDNDAVKYSSRFYRLAMP